METYIRVAIVEDDKELVELVSGNINADTRMVVAECFYDAESAIRRLPIVKPDVAIVDINLPAKNGIEIIAELKHRMPDTQFMVVTSMMDDALVFEVLKAGATGYLSKSTDLDTLTNRIMELAQGGSPMSSHIARRVVQSFAGWQQRNDNEQITARETEILRLLADGYRYKEIADRIFLSTETVRTHIRNIYLKLQVNSRTEALNKFFGKPSVK